MFQLIRATVALAGDIRSTVVRKGPEALTYPEYLLLEFLHGTGCMTDVAHEGWVERSQAEERARLNRTYQTALVQQLFPGIAGRLPASSDTINGYRPPNDDLAAVVPTTKRKGAKGDPGVTASLPPIDPGLGALEAAA